MRVKNRNLQFLVDSGNSSSLISNKVAHILGLKLERTANVSLLIAASGQQLNVLEKPDMNFYVKDLVIVHSFTVVKKLISKFVDWR